MECFIFATGATAARLKKKLQMKLREEKIECVRLNWSEGEPGQSSGLQ
jgi:hypothetical protein